MNKTTEIEGKRVLAGSATMRLLVMTAAVVAVSALGGVVAALWFRDASCIILFTAIGSILYIGLGFIYLFQTRRKFVDQANQVFFPCGPRWAPALLRYSMILGVAYFTLCLSLQWIASLPRSLAYPVAKIVTIIPIFSIAIILIYVSGLLLLVSLILALGSHIVARWRRKRTRVENTQ